MVIEDVPLELQHVTTDEQSCTHLLLVRDTGQRMHLRSGKFRCLSSTGQSMPARPRRGICRVEYGINHDAVDAPAVVMELEL